jgi:hypothetical protein
LTLCRQQTAPNRARQVFTSDYSVTEFLREFSDDAACLEHLWRTHHSLDGEHAYCPRCDGDKVFRRYGTPLLGRAAKR